jgi:hypothetical protein
MDFQSTSHCVLFAEPCIQLAITSLYLKDEMPGSEKQCRVIKGATIAERIPDDYRVNRSGRRQLQ